MRSVDLYFDPICPWCWVTSRWLEEVRPLRDLDLRWRSFSLHLKNADLERSDEARRATMFGLRCLRVVEAVRELGGEPAVATFYTELGSRIHHDRDREFDLADALEGAGLDRSISQAADDETWDTTIESSMKEALALAGDDVGVPLIAFDGAAAFFGPVVSPAPTGEAAAELFDHVSALAMMPGFWELKRSRSGRPELGDRPDVTAR